MVFEFNYSKWFMKSNNKLSIKKKVSKMMSKIVEIKVQKRSKANCKLFSKKRITEIFKIIEIDKLFQMLKLNFNRCITA